MKQFKSAPCILLALAMLFLASCTTTKTARVTPNADPIDLTEPFQGGEFISKVDGLVILLDASSSMSETFQGYRKFDIAKAFVHNMNNTMPPISADSGLRTFGHSTELTRKNTELFYGMTPYSRDEMKAGIDKVTPAGGPTPMATAIAGVGSDLEQVQGSKAVVIVSDGKDLNEEPIQAALTLAEKLGEELCIYTVLVGDDPEGKELMEGVAATTPCGFMALAQNISPPEPMAGYVAQVFLDQPAKELGLGYHPPEPDLPKLTGVHFRFDSAELTPEGRSILDQHIQVLNKQPDLKLIINGHTSAKGTENYNQKLSEQRAESVKTYLVDKGNIDSEKITARGYGETQPAMPESDPDMINSKEARANMRVVLEVLP